MWSPRCRSAPTTRQADLRLRYGLSYRDVKELLAERGIAVDQLLELGKHGMQDDLLASGFHPFAVAV